MSDIGALRRVIKRDSRFKQFLKNFQGNPAYNLDFAELHSELQRLHATRITRELRRKRSRSFPEKLAEAMLQDQAVRSRCAEILGECAKINDAMTRTLSNVRDYLLSEYAGNLKVIATATERKAFVESSMKQFYEFQSDVAVLEKSAKIIIEDIDKANYMFRNMVELVKVLSRPEQVLL